MSADDYLIREATVADTERIVDLLMNHYMSQESIFQSYMSQHRNEIDETKMDELLQSISGKIRRLLAGNPTLVAVHRTSQAIIGQMVMEPQKKPSTPSEERRIEYERELASAPKVIADLVKHLEEINRRANLDDAFPGVGKSLKLRYLGVHPDHRRKGLASVLLRAGVEYARRNDYLLVHGIFSSVFSQRAAEVAGFSCSFRCHLNEFRNDRGERAFANVNPDTFVCVMTIEPAKNEDDGIAKYLVP